MDRLGVGDLGGADDGRDIKVAVGGARRADAHGFVGQAHVFRVAVGLGVDRHGLDAERAAGACTRSAISPRLAMTIFSILVGMECG